MVHFLKLLVFKFKQFKYNKQIAQVKSVDIQKPFNISDFNKIKFSKYIYIGPESYIMSKGGVEIGNNVIIGPKVTMWTENHNFNSSKMVPYDEYDIPKPIIIGDNVWIGLGVFICPGTKIGEGAIVGMGSVVRGNIPPLAIVFGNPAQIIGYRDENVYRDIIENKGFYLKNKKEMSIERKNIDEMNNYEVENE